jgi:hypothetical protein
MKLWFVQQTEGGPEHLQALLQQVEAQGWTVFSVLTNGINRWTIVTWRSSFFESPTERLPARQPDTV